MDGVWTVHHWKQKGSGCRGVCKSPLPVASIFPVKQKARLSVESEDGGGGRGILE